MKTIVGSIGLAMMLSIPGMAATGVAEIRGTAPGSSVSGTVMLEEVPNGLRVRVALSGVPAGDHGFHIHEFGSCADTGKAAGSHYNPMSAPHGQILHAGVGHAHAGDLGNITAGADGKASLEAVIPGIALIGGGLSVAGRAIILHEKVDDFSQPLGNAGGRIGCGPIVLTGPVAPAPAAVTPASSKK